MVIDGHTHIFPPRVIADRERIVASDGAFRDLYASPKTKLATADGLLASMDRDGVDVSVALNLSWRSADLCARTNDYIMESVARYPKRLVGFGTVDPTSSGAAREVERCARGGLRGIGEMRLDAAALASPAVADCLSAIEEHGLVLLVHTSEPVGHQYAGKGDTTPGRLYPLIARFPKLRMIAAHWGGGLPFYALMPEVQKSFGNVYFDTAASPFLYRPEVYGRVIDLVGAEHVLFGSDFPLLAPGRVLREIRSQALPPEQQRLILGGNAARLLGLTE